MTYVCPSGTAHLIQDPSWQMQPGEEELAPWKHPSLQSISVLFANTNLVQRDELKFSEVPLKF
jgi:hypothetical protein